jgi:pentatricopeptide repeat protein
MPQPFRFGDFELDADRRALRLRGRELALQPRVFDLLAYLVRHRDRVVPKDELLDTLWPGVVVTESSLQRAVSLARAALQEGRLEDAIRNYSRRGYRFLLEPGPLQSPGVSADDAYAAARWREAIEAYAEADRLAPLDAEALERWATAGQCAGELTAAVLPLERAAVAYASRSEHEAGARVLISLARVQIESLHAEVAQGYLRRAARLLQGVPRGEQHGLLAAMTARLHLFQGDLRAAAECAVEARELGRALHNGDVETMGLLYEGIALQAAGETRRGLELQNEAAASVLAGNVSPLLGGIVYCGMISSCCHCGDWHRAEQWTESFTRWCRRGNIEAFTGSCLIHKAEVLVMSGRLQEARELLAGAEPVLREGAPWALGDAHRLTADVQFACGELGAAERSYREAHQRGWDPWPGYALLLHRLGRGEEALAGLARAATSTNWAAAERRALYVAQAAQIAARMGRRDDAQARLAGLEATPDAWNAGAVEGHVHQARAELQWLRGEHEAAVASFQRGIDVHRRFRAVMDLAQAQLRLAECLLTRGESAAAQLEIDAAAAAFDAAGATGHRETCRAIAQKAALPKTH